MFTVGSLAIVVKGIAFVKELVVASKFGSSDSMDAYVSAFTLWSFVIGVIGGGMPDAIVPVYSKAKQQGKLIADKIAINCIWIYVAKLTFIVCVLALAAETIIPWLTLGYSDEKRALTVELTRYLAPIAVLWGTSVLMTMLLQANKRFFLAAAAPAAIPACAVIGLLLGYERLGIHALVAGTIFGAVVQVLIVTSAFFREHSSFAWPQLKNLWDGPMKLLFQTTWPYLLSGMVMCSTLLVDVGMAGGLDQGSVSVLSYAERLCTIGLVVATALVTEALYPYLSDMVASEQWRLLRQTTLRFGGLIILTSIPVVAIIWVGSEWIVRLLFERDGFTAEDTTRVASLLRWLSLQIPFNLLAVLGSRVVCAMLASRFMLLTTAVNFGLNIAGNYYFAKFMGVEGIALSTAIVYFVSAAMLFGFLAVQIGKKLR